MAIRPLPEVIPVNAGFHHSSQAKHDRRGGLGLVKDASILARPTARRTRLHEMNGAL
jgi:hypothetical protein